MRYKNISDLCKAVATSAQKVSVEPTELESLIDEAKAKGELDKLYSGLDQNNISLTILHIACERGVTDLVEALLRKGADINKTTGNGRTPLHCACVNGDPKIVQMLLAAGAKADVVDNMGQTPMHLTCICSFRDFIDTAERITIAQSLLEKGAKADAVDKSGKTPGQYALEQGSPKLATAVTQNALANGQLLMKNGMFAQQPKDPSSSSSAAVGAPPSYNS